MNLKTLLLLVPIIALPGHSGIIAVYGTPGSSPSLDSLRAFAQTLQPQLKALGTPEEPISVSRAVVDNPDIAGYRIASGSSLAAVFSIYSGVTAYILSDGPIEIVEDFRMEGQHLTVEGPTDESDVPQEPNSTVGVTTQPQVYGNALLAASVSHNELSLRFSLSGGKTVVVRIFSLSGQTLGAWKWKEGGAGEFRKTFALKHSPTGPYFIRWESGNLQVTQKIAGQTQGSAP